MNQLETAKRAAVVRALVEGNSIRSTVRMTGVAKNTVVKLLVELGTACEAFHDRTVRAVTSKRVQVDEVWSFCYAKAKNIPRERVGEPGIGDTWTWTAIDADSKLMVSWLVGLRDVEHAYEFMNDVAARLANRVQLMSDGLRAYLQAVPGAFGRDIDYGVVLKLYGPDKVEALPQSRYSPARSRRRNAFRSSANPNASTFRPVLSKEPTSR